MEQWSFPPRFDAAYAPPPGSRYWFPQRETRPAADRDKAILARLKEVTRYAWDRSPMYRRMGLEAGSNPDHHKSLVD
jgi:phenylacetate-CoA ligase